MNRSEERIHQLEKHTTNLHNENISLKHSLHELQKQLAEAHKRIDDLNQRLSANTSKG